MTTDWFPVDPEEHSRQMSALLHEIGARPGKVLDLGCGDGRVARELTKHRHRVLAIDRDPSAIDAIKAVGDPLLSSLCADFLQLETSALTDFGPVDAAVCLGHTFMLIADPDDAVRLMTTIRQVTRPGGVFVIDSFCRDVWLDVAEGNWQSGVSEDGSLQMVWAESDEVIAIRQGDRVDESDWEVRESDQALRLWSMGSLSLLARASGWLGPLESDNHALILFRKAHEAL